MYGVEEVEAKVELRELQAQCQRGIVICFNVVTYGCGGLGLLGLGVYVEYVCNTLQVGELMCFEFDSNARLALIACADGVDSKDN